MFHRVLVLGWSLCFWGALTVNGNTEESYSLRLVGGDNRCRGELQVQRSGEDWTIVHPVWFSLQLGNRACAMLDCGTALTVERKDIKSKKVVRLEATCTGSSLASCFKSGVYIADESLQLNCSDSVRLVSGHNMCSGSLQTRDPSLKPDWTPVCDGALDRQGAEVVCRDLGCGAPQGELSTQGQMCKGQESSLQDCPRTCTGPPLNITCTEPLRLVGGANRCEGTAEVEYRGEWRRILNFSPTPWDLGGAATVCKVLNCGTAVSIEQRDGVDPREVWLLTSDCVKEKAAVRDCVFAESNEEGGTRVDVKVVCSGKD